MKLNSRYVKSRVQSNRFALSLCYNWSEFTLNLNIYIFWRRQPKLFLTVWLATIEVTFLEANNLGTNEWESSCNCFIFKTTKCKQYYD